MPETQQGNDSLIYFQYPGVSGDYFVCPGYNGYPTISVGSCAARWQRSQDKTDKDGIRMQACINCPIGAKHAGVKNFMPRSQVATTKICCRCHRLSNRIIHGRLCVSCVNRQYEFFRGKNAKGTKPVKCKNLKPIPLVVSDGSERPAETSFIAEDMLEAILSAMKTSSKAVAVGFKGLVRLPSQQQQLQLI